MSDDDQLRRLLSDAVSDIEPRDRLTELHSSLGPASRGGHARDPRFAHVVTGIVATAAVIGIVAFVTHAAVDRSRNAGPATDTSGLPSATATAIDTSAPSPTATASGTGAVYYLGSGPRGTVLYREFGRRPAGESPLDYAIEGLMAEPADPDYRTAWRRGWLRRATTGNAQIRVDVGDAPEARPASMSARDASEAVQQVVYTVQAAVQRRYPVLFTRHGSAVTSVLGVPTSLPVSQGPPLDVLSRMSITDPAEGTVLNRGRLVVSGVNNSFEASVLVQLKRAGHVYRSKPGIASGYMAERLFPWRLVLDTRSLPPGRYTLTASNDDPSGRNRAETDTRSIELR